MISEFSLHAKPSNKKAMHIVTACFASALVCLGASMFVEKYRGLISLGVLILITVALFFYTKYLAAEYIYDITTDSDGKPLFIVRNRTGKRETTLSRLDFSSIRRAERKSAEELKSYTPEAGVLRYYYCPSYRPDTAILITVRSRYEKADIFIEAPDEFMNYINSAASETARLYPEEDD